MKKLLVLVLVLFVFVGCSSQQEKKTTYREVINAYKQNILLQLKPDNAWTHLNSANIMLKKLASEDSKTKSNSVLRVIDEYKTAIMLEPSLSQAHYGLALAYITAKKDDQALMTLEKLILLNPGYYDAYLLQGMIYENQKDYIKAEKAFIKLVELQPQSEQPYILLGDLYILQKQYGKAEGFLKQALHLNPQNKLAKLALKKVKKKLYPLKKV